MKGLIDTATGQAIRDVVLLCAVEHGTPLLTLSQAQGGPTFIQFDTSWLVMEQPLGREAINCAETTIEQWAEMHYDPEYEYAVFSVFEMACYRRNRFDSPTFVNEIVGFCSGKDSSFSALLLHLSTGGTLGFDATSDEGLRLFFDGHLSLFNEEYARPLSLGRTSIWRRSGET